MTDIDLYYAEGPLPETPAPAERPEPWGETRIVGKPTPRIDAYERVSGTAVYPSDVILPDMLHGAILRCPHAHAIVKRLDTSAAEKMPGVRAVITGATPGCDIPWYGSRSGPLSRIFDAHCRHEGDEVAAVAAETPYQAWDAVRAITVEYDFQIRDLYLCPNVQTEAHDAYVNAGPSRAFRAPGHPQGNWALEQMMDALAAKIGMDPVELRVRNVPTISQARGNQPYTSTGLKACLVEGAKAFGWRDARARAKMSGPIRRGVGVAAGMWQGGGGSPPSTVIVKLFADGSANLNMGASDNGCGTKTWMAMIVAEELGVPLDRIQIEYADTATTQFATPSGGSKTVPTEAPAARAAALEVKRQLLELAAEQLKIGVEDLTVRDGLIVSTKDPAKALALAQVTGLQRRGVIVGVGLRGPNPEGKAITPWAAHFAEVEVNTRTGEVKVVRYLAAQDSGRVMNRLTYDNQVIGAVAMGIGLALTEERVLDRGRTGRMVNANFHDYMIPTAMEVPVDQTVLAIDPHDTECNTAGAKGIGEPATVPVASAVANAVYHAIGVRMSDSPISPAAIVRALNQPAAKRS